MAVVIHCQIWNVGSYFLSLEGITRDSKVVVYDSLAFLGGTFMVDVTLPGFNGCTRIVHGIERWIKEGHVLTKEPTHYPQNHLFFQL